MSYSHKDDKWAKWLLKAIEAYRVPGHLVGTKGTNGTVPAKLTRIFRDREELAAGACLDAKIQEALKQSKTLLVACSPNAVHSYGVNQEIELFRKMRGDQHIFYIILEGEPHAAARGLDPELECFPKALINHDMDTTTAYGVPLAADDARPQGDGKKMALLKVVAGILGVNLDTLVRRDLHRRQKRLWGFMGLATAGMMLTSGLATQAYLASQRAEEALAHAQRQQDEAESLIQYIVDDLGQHLWRRGHADLLEAMSSRILDHYDGQNSPDMGPKEIARKVRGLAMLSRGRIFNSDQSEIAERLEDLRQKTRETIEQHPESWELLLTHIYILKLLSDLKLLAGDYEVTRTLIEERLATAERAYKLQPNRHPDDRAGIGNALIDLAQVQMHAFQQPEKAYDLIKEGLAIRIAVGQMPDNIGTYREVANVDGGYYHLSVVQEIVAPLPEAIASLEKSLYLYRKRQELSPVQGVANLLYYRFHIDLAELLFNSGHSDEALQAVDAAQKNLRKILANNEENHRYRTMIFRGDMLRGLLLMGKNRWADAEQAFAEATEGMTAQYQLSLESVDTVNWILTSKTLWALSMAKMGQVTKAVHLMNQVTQETDQTPARLLHSIHGRKTRSILANARAELAVMQGTPGLARSIRQQMIASLGPKWRQSHPVVRFELMKAYIATGQWSAAQEIADNLTEIGFARPDFLQELEELDRGPGNTAAEARPS
ncbi:TIR domain-containing protein [Kordiimonas lipolytica]|uniref:TIR domain-containing protein n=1 Tax=Kordiimonas lipolytica TaxID=1662421 RepID=A0ABV8U8F9_9PROT|nr:TIR domain-containing protein [Kordiimonas lipolytica]